jgi:uncharacterized membrane protein
MQLASNKEPCAPQKNWDADAGPSAPGLNWVLERNIEALMERRREDAAAATREERFATAITRFTGSMVFVYVHLVIFGAWIAANVWGLPGIPRFDPSLAYLAVAASLEAIFLATFVLITQNRMSAAADRRADLHVQMTLLVEHELTRSMAIVSAIAQKLGVTTSVDSEVEELTQDVAAEAVLDKLESAESVGNPSTAKDSDSAVLEHGAIGERLAISPQGQNRES